MSKKSSFGRNAVNLLATTAITTAALFPGASSAFGQTFTVGVRPESIVGITTVRPSAAVTRPFEASQGSSYSTAQTGRAPCTTPQQSKVNHVLPAETAKMLQARDVIVYPCMNGDKKHGVAFRTDMNGHDVDVVGLLDFGKMVGLVSEVVTDKSRPSGYRSAYTKFKINEDRRTGGIRVTINSDSERNGDSYSLVNGEGSQDVFALLATTAIRVWGDNKDKPQHLVSGRSYRSHLPIGGYLDLVDMSGARRGNNTAATVYARPDRQITVSMPSFDPLTNKPDDVSFTFTMNGRGNPSIIDQAVMNNRAMLKNNQSYRKGHTGPTIGFTPELVGLQQTAARIMYLSEALYLHTHPDTEDPQTAPQTTGKFFAGINRDMAAMWPEFNEGDQVPVTRADEHIPGMGDTMLVNPKQTKGMSRQQFKDYVHDYLDNVQEAIRQNFSQNDTPMFDNPWATPNSGMAPKLLSLAPTTPGEKSTRTMAASSTPSAG